MHKRILVHIILIAGLLLAAFPFFWMASSSLKSKAETTAVPPTVLPDEYRFENFTEAWSKAPFARYFFNTTIY